MVVFASLGAVVLDTIEGPDMRTVKDIPGGSAVYSTLGARLFARSKPGVVALVIKAGSDFPDKVVDKLSGWGVKLLLVTEEYKLSTRGKITYGNIKADERKFEWLTELLVTLPKDLKHSQILASTAFHFYNTPQEITQLISALTDERGAHKPLIPAEEPPLIVWEPKAKSCVPKDLAACLEATKLVDVFSPNAKEIARLFGNEGSEIPKEMLEVYAKIFIDSGMKDNSCIIIRAAEHGCLVSSRGHGHTWLPAFYEQDAEKVVDTIGAGNTFLGGFIMGWHKTDDFVEAAKYGSVAASFALEQIGLPTRNGKGEAETWNGVSVSERLEEYRSRV